MSRFYELDGLARKLAEASPNSEYLKSLWGEPGGVCDQLDLDSVTERQIERAKQQVYRLSQEALAEDHVPDEITVYHGGRMRPDDPTLSVTTDLHTASEPYFAGHGGVWQATVARKDILVAVEAIIAPWKVYEEHEYIVPRAKLRNVKRVKGIRPRLSR